MRKVTAPGPQKGAAARMTADRPQRGVAVAGPTGSVCTGDVAFADVNTLSDIATCGGLTSAQVIESAPGGRVAHAHGGRVSMEFDLDDGDGAGLTTGTFFTGRCDPVRAVASAFRLNATAPSSARAMPTGQRAIARVQ